MIDDEETALKFTAGLNSNNWGIQFTLKYNKHTIDFLYLIIQQEKVIWISGATLLENGKLISRSDN